MGNEKHDVVTAVDIKEAFESYGGVRGCRIAVAELDVAKAAKPVEWKGISALFNFEFLPPELGLGRLTLLVKVRCFHMRKQVDLCRVQQVFISSCLLRLSPHCQIQG